MSPEELLPRGATVLLYFDPTSGSMLLQMIVAGVAGSWLVIKLWGRRIMMFFRRGGGGGDE